MQHNNTKIKQKVLQGVLGVLWVAGLLIAGSDNDHMPWINGLGLLIFFGASLFLGKRLNENREHSRTVIHADFSKKQAPQNRRCHSRYALSA